jgi:translation initiation factor 2B subunit (eIF-2B alpha/beta/delta family)
MSFEVRIKELIADNYSGSAAILDKLIKSIYSYINNRNIEPEFLRENLLKVARSFPDLAVLHHFLQYFLDSIEPLIETNISNSRKKIKIEAIIAEYNKEWDESIDRAAEKMARLVQFYDKRILLHSNSSSIHILFKHLAVRKIYPAIYQTMSGPVFEGKLQARILADMGCTVHFINEAAVGKFIHEIDFAVVGADNVFKDGFTNKVGTYPIALVCREAGIPLYVICDSRKRSPLEYSKRSNIIPEQEAPSSELWPKAPDSIKPVNYYFEFTPRNLVTAYFFDDCFIETNPNPNQDGSK